MGPNLETSDDSTGNGLANLLVEREHLDDIERTDGCVTVIVRKTLAMEFDQQNAT